MSELIIIQESSDAAAKDLDRPMYLRPEDWGLKGWRPENGMGISVFGCSGPDYGERTRVLGCKSGYC